MPFSVGVTSESSGRTSAGGSVVDMAYSALVPDEVTEDVDEHGRKLFGPVQHGESGAAENPRRVPRRLAIDRQAEHRDPLSPRFRDRLPRIFHPIAALVDIHVVRLPIGQDEQETARRRFTAERRGEVTDRRAETGVAVGVQRRNPPADRDARRARRTSSTAGPTHRRRLRPRTRIRHSGRRARRAPRTPPATPLSPRPRSGGPWTPTRPWTRSTSSRSATASSRRAGRSATYMRPSTVAPARISAAAVT